MKVKRFEDLDVWKESIIVTKSIYFLSSSGAFSKDFSLRDQIRRSCVSISSNIAEGYERNSINEFIRFLKIAKGSAGEARSQLYLVYEIGYINKVTLNKINHQLLVLSKKLSALIHYLNDSRASSN